MVWLDVCGILGYVFYGRKCVLWWDMLCMVGHVWYGRTCMVV
jgi:hypothetical protein